MTCRTCGSSLDPAARFCPQCGTRRQTVDERRVVTALFADIVGFTALSENMDPEQVKILVDRCFERLTRDIVDFGGVVDKVMGDGIVALFGAPTAHGDDAERAVRAGLKMQRTLEDLAAETPESGVDTKTGSDDSTDTHAFRIRIGINTGEVLVGTSPAGGDYTAMGDVMNSASRLERLAQPGQVLVGAATKQVTDTSIRYQSAGLLEARGRDEPLEGWIALEAVGQPGAHRRRSALFVGRGRELELLESQGRLGFELDQAQLALVLGEAGIGKSRLVSEVSDRLRRRFGTALWSGRCLPYGEANVWWPTAEMIRGHFAIPFDLPQVEAETILTERLGMVLDSVWPGAPPSILDRRRVALLHMLGYSTTLRGGDRRLNRNEVMQAFSDVLEEQLSTQPVVMVISDMHWAGEAVWEVVSYVLNRFSRRNLLVMATARDLEQDAILQGRHGFTVTRLGPLNDDATRQLLASLRDSDDRSDEELVARSGGNPFFLEELATLGVESGDDLPDTLRGMIAARLDALDTDTRAVLDAAAVLGRSGPVEGLAALVAGQPAADDFDHHINTLSHRDLLAVDGPRYEFSSDLVKDVAYGILTKSVRAARHRDIARFIERLVAVRPDAAARNSEVVAIADHYSAAAALVTELDLFAAEEVADLRAKALMWIEQAGERALEAGEPTDAERWFSQGQEMAEQSHLRGVFLYGRARARSDMRDLAGARADLTMLDDYAEHNAELAARALVVTGDVSRKAGDLDSAAGQLREAADRLAVLGVSEQQCLALRLLGLTEMSRSSELLAHQAFEASREVAANAGDRRSEAWALQSMAWLSVSEGRVREANNLVATAVELFLELGDSLGLLWTQCVQAWVAFHLGQLAMAEQLVEQLLPQVRRRSDRWAEVLTLNLAASLALWSGRAGQAVRLAGEAAELARRSDQHGLLVQALALEGRSLVSIGQVADGGTTLSRAFHMAERHRDVHYRRLAIIANCASAARLGEPERALRWASLSEGPHEDPQVVGEADLVASVAMALLQRGHILDARTEMSWLDNAEQGGASQYASTVHAIVAAAEGDRDEVERSAEYVAEASSTYLDRINVLLARAAVRHQTGDSTACADDLAAARALVAKTDDQITRWIIDLVAALCGRGDLERVQHQITGGGLDPLGLTRMWGQAVRGASPEPVSR